MSDRRLRELEQRWLATRDLDVERELVQARVRAGTLPRPRLLFAAYVGSVAAQRALGDRGFAEEPNLLTWVRGLGRGRLGRYPLLVRGAAARAVGAAFALAQRELDGSTAPAEDVLLAELATLLGHLEACRAGTAPPPLGEGSRLTLWTERLLRATAPEDVTKFAALLVDEVAKLLRGTLRHQRQALRQALAESLTEWALAS
ncbi:MAG: hypothetical protein R3F62_14045 [Planctomycetota bacterium]